MTSFWKVYEAFLAKILEDEWGDWAIEETEADMRQILESAIPYFKFPRVSLERTDEGFVDALAKQLYGFFMRNDVDKIYAFLGDNDGKTNKTKIKAKS